MSTELAGMDNELFYEPEDGYWAGKDRLEFETKNLLAEWPKPANLFVRRMAANVSSQSGQQNITLTDFKQLVGALIETNPQATYRFMVVPMNHCGSPLAVRLIEVHHGSLPPLRADNACSIEMAFGWLAKSLSHFELSCAACGNYWVKKS
ncbi:hypothetical protein ACI77O_12055 [Pseudomonas tritici]|uniref:hypothetical protein n=1 Tax=Pseudomonas tritici TaxID=2745518 RepID=UPI00387B2CD6